MPRGTDPQDRGWIQGRLWVPSILSPSKLLAWYDASDYGDLASATGLSQWGDKSGNGRHLTQPTGGNQPSFIAPSTNVQAPHILFNGSTSYFVMNSPFVVNAIQNGGVTICMYMKPVTITSSNSFIGEGNSASATPFWRLTYGATTSTKLGHTFRNDAATTFADEITVTGALTNATFQVTSVSIISGAQDGRAKGDATTAAAQTDVMTGTTTLDRFAVGARVTNTVGNFCSFRCMEIVIVAGVDPILRQVVEGYLDWKYRVQFAVQQATNAAQHPYVNRPPDIGTGW